MTVIEYLKDLRKTVSAHFKGLKEGSYLNKPKTDIMQVFEQVHREYAPVFVLSTGRCGTMLLAQVLELHSDARVFHDPYPELARPAVQSYRDPENLEFSKGIVEGGRYEMIRDAYLLKKVFIEPNNKITFLAPAIDALYPKARFIHLVRSKKAFVKSGLRREWYAHVKLDDEGRITGEGADWEAMSREEKIGWLWETTNDWIADFLEGIGDERKMKVEAEALFTEPSVSEEIFRFVGLEPISKDQIAKKISKKVNKSK